MTNGDTWLAQRRIIDPAFAGGRLRDVFSPMLDAAQAATKRLNNGSQTLEVEEFSSHVAADIIFRTLFSIPITHHVASRVFAEFRAYQRSQPILNLAAFLPLPRWLPRFQRRATRKNARNIRKMIAELVEQRSRAIRQGRAPDDLATKIMTQQDPEPGQCLDAHEMVDKVAIFFLAGHETSAAALAWSLYLLALYPDHQQRLAEEAARLPKTPKFGDISSLRFARNVFREALRLYPPVPMMVRETTRPERFRNRTLGKGSQVVISPWHLHRHERLWKNPDAFDPDRFATDAGIQSMREAFIPFSAGARACPGAGYAMLEGPLVLALLVRQFRFFVVPGRVPVPQAHLTVRSKDGIWLRVEAR
jgi:cytochrome P450